MRCRLIRLRLLRGRLLGPSLRLYIRGCCSLIHLRLQLVLERLRGDVGRLGSVTPLFLPFLLGGLLNRRLNGGHRLSRVLVLGTCWLASVFLVRFVITDHGVGG